MIMNNDRWTLEKRFIVASYKHEILIKKKRNAVLMTVRIDCGTCMYVASNISKLPSVRKCVINKKYVSFGLKV